GGAFTFRNGFASPQVLYSYELRNLAILAGLLLLSGGVLWLARRDQGRRTKDEGRRTKDARREEYGGTRPPRLTWSSVFRPSASWRPLALLLVAGDLGLLLGGFNPASDPSPLAFTPPMVEFLRADPDRFRVIVFGGSKPFPANLPMLEGLDDARGYD